MTDPRFIHLRLHTEFSVSDGLVRVDEAVDRARATGMPALGLTDLSNTFGWIKFYRAARGAGIKPVWRCCSRRGWRPAGSWPFFERLARQAGAPPALLSTHPDPGDRARLLAAELRQRGGWAVVPLEPDWAAVRADAGAAPD